jgi:N-sulfoglucosamine sulfohydrolase
MIATLEKWGMLENTLIIVTSDHGMPFPRGKGNEHENANHVPMAAMWKGGIKGSHRVVDDYISFIDLAPTFIDLAGLPREQTGMASSPGRSLREIFESEKSGIIDPGRDHVLIGKERRDVGRPNDEGYPIRGIVMNHFIYLKNFETSRWPSGNPETGYLNVDGGATKSFILAEHRKDPGDRFWATCFGKRPAEELDDLGKDRECLENLSSNEASKSKMGELKARMENELRAQEDPRMFGHGAVFEKYPYADSRTANFHERHMRGEKLNAGWVSPSDFEKTPLD